MEALKDFILKFNHLRTVSRSHVIGEPLLFLNQMGLQNLQIKARLDINVASSFREEIETA